MPATASTPPAERSMPLTGHERWTPLWLRIAGSWCWRIVAITLVFVILAYVSAKLSLIVVPVLIAIIITAGISPLTTFLERHKFPRWLGSLLSMLLLILVISGLLALVGAQIAMQWSQLATAAVAGVTQIIDWLGTGPLGIDSAQINGLLDQLWEAIRNSSQRIAGWVASFGSSVGNFFAGFATVLFATFFFTKEGEKMVTSMEPLIPDNVLMNIRPAVQGGWRSLTSYVRTTVIVAGIDAIGAAIGAAALGSRLWLAIMALTFVCAFVPIIGSIVAGAVATAVVLVTLGPIKAIIMLVVFILVLNIESNVLQPLLMGRAVNIHPLIILLGITTGALIAGIVGAVVIIPIVAFVSGFARVAIFGENLVGDEDDAKPMDKLRSNPWAQKAAARGAERKARKAGVAPRDTVTSAEPQATDGIVRTDEPDSQGDS